MASPETKSNPGEYLNDVLFWRPPLPVGKFDYSDIISGAETLRDLEPGYAWERVPRFVAEIKETFDRVEADSLDCLDVGSSVPNYTQMLRAIQFGRSGDRARELEGPLFGSPVFEKLRKNGRADLNPLVVALSKDRTARALLTAAIQEVLYGITPEEASSVEMLKHRFVHQLVNQRQIYLEEPGNIDIEAAWGIRFSAIETEQTYLELLTQLAIPSREATAARQRLQQRQQEHAGSNPDQQTFDFVSEYDMADRTLAQQTTAVGLDLVSQYFAWQTDYLANSIAGKSRFKPARFFSMDISEPSAIAMSSLVNTPATTRSMNLFSHAIGSLFDKRQHIKGDMFKPLHFPDNSLALITLFDGWPFHFQVPEGVSPTPEKITNVALATMEHYYDKLAYGGEIVIFPWTLPNAGPEEEHLLKTIEVELGNRIRNNTSIKRYPSGVLKTFMMSESDKVTAESASRIFLGGNDSYEVLVIQKPKKEIVAGRAATALALSQARDQGSPDPMP